MMNERQQIERTHNTARFFTETRHVAWVLLIGTMLWGVFGYLNMPQRKDPDIPVRQALALCPWPGASAEKIEQLVTRRIEEKIAENVRVEKIESNTRTGITAVYITLVEGTTDTGKEFDDIKLKLDAITNLPDGAGPIEFVKDFGDTAALMLTVASPRVGEAEIATRAQALRQEIETTRKSAPSADGPRLTIVQGVPTAVPAELVRRPLRLFAEEAGAAGSSKTRESSSDLGSSPSMRCRRRRMPSSKRSRNSSFASGCGRRSFIPMPGRSPSFAIRRRPRRDSPRSPATSTPTPSSTTTPT